MFVDVVGYIIGVSPDVVRDGGELFRNQSLPSEVMTRFVGVLTMSRNA